MLTVRTDLAIEARELVDKDYPKEIPGMEIDKDEYDGIKITRVKIRTKEAEEIMGKPIGNYISIEVPRLREKDIELQERVSKNFANEMKNIADLSSNTTTMVIGLGNWNITPDSLGPKTVEKLFITRHMIDKLEGENEEKRFGSLCAFSPGVLGITGIESAEVIHG
ncbi:MAG TPA: GPR endopeptidase [Thermoanaerobacterales bacterium]|nr:GPR endopeptidase [Thermoanaerobacterales bacterium]